MTARRSAILLVVLGAIAGLLLIKPWAAGPQRPGEILGSSVASPPPVPEDRLVEEVRIAETKLRERNAKPGLLRHKFEPGDVLSYTIQQQRTTSQRVKIDPSKYLLDPASSPVQLQNGLVTLEFRIHGILEVRAYPPEEEFFTLGFRLRNLSVQAGLPPELVAKSGPEGQEALKKSEDLQKALTGGETVVHLAEDGRITGIEFPSDSRAEVRTMIRSLLCDQQLRFPPDPATEWEIEEIDTTGKYVASYASREMEDGEGRAISRIQKRKKAFQRIHAVGEEASAILSRIERVETGDAAVILFDPEKGRLLSLSQDCRTLVRVSAEMEFESTGSTRLLLTASGKDPRMTRPPKGVRQGLVPEGLAAGLYGREKDRWLRQLKAEGVTLDTLLARRKELQLLDPEKNSAALHELFLKLGKLLRYDDEAAAAMGSLLRQPNRDDDVETEFILGALAKAGSPAAQKTLAGLSSDLSLPADLRSGALMSSSLVSQPPLPETEQAVRTAVRSDPDPGVRGMALAAAGTMSLQLQQCGDPTRADSLRTFIEENPGDPKDTTWKILWVTALGNTHSAAAYPAVEAELKNANVIVASHAAEALGRIPHPDSERRLTELLQPDSAAPEIAVGAIKGLEERKKDEIRRLLTGVAEKDPREVVRNQAQQTLQRMPEDLPETGVPIDFLPE